MNLLWNSLRDPYLAFDAINWTVQRYLMHRQPTRSLRGVTLGDFSNFSEFHTFPKGVSDAESEFIRSHDFGAGEIIDVGANIGYFSLLIAKANPNRRVIAIEPGGSTFSTLNSNVMRNHLRVECLQLAVASEDGTVQFEMKEKARANSSITRDSAGVAVMARQLDTIVRELAISRIALLKIDTEGYEVDVLKGAMNTLKRVRPAYIYFEVCPQLTIAAGYDPAEPAQIIADAGYDLFELRGRGDLVPVRPQDASECVLANWIARA